MDQNRPCLTYSNLVLHILQIQFQLAGWIENPIKSKVLTFPINKILFPTVTLCPRDSRPDRWGSVIKIFDQMETDCVSKRWAYMYVQFKGPIISFRTSEEKHFCRDSFFQLSFHPKRFYYHISPYSFYSFLNFENVEIQIVATNFKFLPNKLNFCCRNYMRKYCIWKLIQFSKRQWTHGKISV